MLGGVALGASDGMNVAVLDENAAALTKELKEEEKETLVHGETLFDALLVARLVGTGDGDEVEEATADSERLLLAHCDGAGVGDDERHSVGDVDEHADTLSDGVGEPETRTVTTVAEGQPLCGRELVGQDDTEADSNAEGEIGAANPNEELLGNCEAPGDGEAVSVPRLALHASVAYRLSASEGIKKVYAPPSLHRQLMAKSFAQFPAGSLMHGVVGAQPLGPPQEHT